MRLSASISLLHCHPGIPGSARIPFKISCSSLFFRFSASTMRETQVTSQFDKRSNAGNYSGHGRYYRLPCVLSPLSPGMDLHPSTSLHPRIHCPAASFLTAGIRPSSQRPWFRRPSIIFFVTSFSLFLTACSLRPALQFDNISLTICCIYEDGFPAIFIFCCYHFSNLAAALLK